MGIEKQIKNKFKEYIDKFNDVSDFNDLCCEIIEIVEKNEDLCYNNNKLIVNAETLTNMLDCGRATAVKVGTDAGARIQIGRRVFFKVSKVNEYLQALAEKRGC